MSVPVRILLLAGAVWTFIYVFRCIRKDKMKDDESFYWIISAGVLVLLAVFPEIITELAGLLGVESAVNLVFLIVIFMLILKVFFMDRKLAALRHQTTEVIEKTAIEKLNEEKKNKED
ncbi:MAG: DUF2304 domain-containing protein [Clostridia bacterium]|nr:DUF2304 domain-containing protein [Clostridia bacterium]MBQ6721080.1 DUF2304 domain-containing protein [Clostridia bacterium]MBQ9401442.1 DUF2304 domain-containing protein [Clostridia bacterium]